MIINSLLLLDLVPEVIPDSKAAKSLPTSNGPMVSLFGLVIYVFLVQQWLYYHYGQSDRKNWEICTVKAFALCSRAGWRRGSTPRVVFHRRF